MDSTWCGRNVSTNEKMIEQQKAFVNGLKTNAEFQKGADILEGPIEELKQAIFDTVKRLEAEERAKQDAIKEQGKTLKNQPLRLPVLEIRRRH